MSVEWFGAWCGAVVPGAVRCSPSILTRYSPTHACSTFLTHLILLHHIHSTWPWNGSHWYRTCHTHADYQCSNCSHLRRCLLHQKKCLGNNDLGIVETMSEVWEAQIGYWVSIEWVPVNMNRWQSVSMVYL